MAFELLRRPLIPWGIIALAGSASPVNDRSALIRTAFVSTYPPRRCGIATFTHDLAAICRSTTTVRTTISTSSRIATGQSLE